MYGQYSGNLVWRSHTGGVDVGRMKRADEAGGIYHMLNRANRKETIFHTESDYGAFESILTEALERSELRLYSYCLMPNHWHLVVSPQKNGEMGRFGQWLCLTHTQRYHAFLGTGFNNSFKLRYFAFPNHICHCRSVDHYFACGDTPATYLG